MKCPYCAEHIQDNAVLCRYCYAEKQKGIWKRPTHIAQAETLVHGSQFTIRTAAFFFFLTALFELASVTGPVPLFGAVRDGVVAMIYHLIFIVLYAGMGFGLWTAKEWGFKFMLGGTLFYTFDRLLYIFNGQKSSDLINEYGDLLGSAGQGMITQATSFVTLLFLLSWWGFVFYLYLKRDYFKNR